MTKSEVTTSSCRWPRRATPGRSWRRAGQAGGEEVRRHHVHHHRGLAHAHHQEGGVVQGNAKAVSGEAASSAQQFLHHRSILYCSCSRSHSSLTWSWTSSSCSKFVCVFMFCFFILTFDFVSSSSLLSTDGTEQHSQQSALLLPVFRLFAQAQCSQ